MVSGTGLFYYGICAGAIVALVWILVKFPLFPTEKDIEDFKDESTWFI